MARYELLSADIKYIDPEGHLIRTEEQTLNHIVEADEILKVLHEDLHIVSEEPINWQFDTVNQVLFYTGATDSYNERYTINIDVYLCKLVEREDMEAIGVYGW